MSDDLQAQLDELKATNESLIAKNRELLTEVKTFKAKARGAEIDPAEHEQLKAELEDARAQIKKSEKTYKTEIEKLSSSLSEKDNALQSYLLDGGLSDALAKAGVAAPYMDAAKALLRQQAKIAQEDGKYQALMGDKPILEAVKEWASSEVGKHFVSAPKNSGGGAPGSSSGTATKSFKDMSSEERTALYRNDPARYEQLKQAS